MLTINQKVVENHLRKVEVMEELSEQLSSSYTSFLEQYDSLSHSLETFLLFLKSCEELKQTDVDEHGVVFQTYLDQSYYNIIVRYGYGSVVVKHGHVTRHVDVKLCTFNNAHKSCY